MVGLSLPGVECHGLAHVSVSLRIVEVECCANLHRRTHGGDVSGMGTPVRHIVCRLSWLERCVVQLRVVAFEGGCELWGCAWGVLSGTLLFGPCGKLIFGVYYSVAVEPCAVVVSNDIHEQFPV